MPRLSRRSFLTASAALATGPAFAAGPAATAACGCRHCRRRRGRHRGRAPDRRRRPKISGDRSRRPCRRALRDRYTHLRRAVRPRRALDSCARFQSADQAHGAPRASKSIRRRPSQKVRIGRRYAREGELEDFLALQVRANRGIADAARKGDVACAQALPNDLGDWRPAIEFVLGPFGCGKDLTQVSTVDFAKSHRAQYRCILPPGVRHADRFFRRGDSGQAVDAGNRNRHAARRSGRNAERRDLRPRRDRHRIDQRARIRRHQIHARASQAAARRLRQTLARQLRPHRARTCRQSARLRE